MATAKVKLRNLSKLPLEKHSDPVSKEHPSGD